MAASTELNILQLTPTHLGYAATHDDETSGELSFSQLRCTASFELDQDVVVGGYSIMGYGVCGAKVKAGYLHFCQIWIF
jgi:hypothetical protein